MNAVARLSRRLLVPLLLAMPATAYPADAWTQLDQQVTAHYRSGDVAQALASAQQALALAEREYASGPNAARLATSLNALALMVQAQNDDAQAQALLERAVSVSEKALPADHPNTDALRFNLAAVQEARQNYAAATDNYQRSLDARARRQGDVLPNLQALLRIAIAQHQAAQAESLAQRLLAAQDAQSGTKPADIARTLVDLARARLAQGNTDGVEALLQRSLALRESQLGAEHADLALSLDPLAGFYESQQQAERAEALRRRLLALSTSTAADDPRHAQSLNDVAMAHHGRGEYEQAAVLYEQALPILERHDGQRSVEVARVLANLADTYAGRKQYPQAAALYQRALDIYDQHDDETIARASALNALAVVYYAQRQYRQAEPRFASALQALETERGPEHPELLPVLDNLIALYRSTGRDAKALELQRRGAAIRKAATPAAPAAVVKHAPIVSSIE